MLGLFVSGVYEHCCCWLCHVLCVGRQRGVVFVQVACVSLVLQASWLLVLSGCVLVVPRFVVYVFECVCLCLSVSVYHIMGELACRAGMCCFLLLCCPVNCPFLSCSQLA